MLALARLPADREISLGDADSLYVRAAPDCARFSLRIPPSDTVKAAQAFGCPLPDRIGGVASAEGKLAAKLGPDEWYLMVSAGGEAVETAFSEIYEQHPHSLVDISHREVGITVEGTSAILALRSAVAFDIESMPTDAACRTVFDKVQIVLIRHAANRFRIEVWCSFADHVWGLLRAASREIELGV